jgi:hypothetical protein
MMIPSRKATLMFCVHALISKPFHLVRNVSLDTQSMLLKSSLFYRLASWAIFGNFQPSLRDSRRVFRQPV